MWHGYVWLCRACVGFSPQKRHVIGQRMVYSGQFKMFQSDGNSRNNEKVSNIIQYYPIRPISGIDFQSDGGPRNSKTAHFSMEFGKVTTAFYAFSKLSPQMPEDSSWIFSCKTRSNDITSSNIGSAFRKVLYIKI